MIAEYENGVRKKDHVYMGNQLFATFNGGIVHYHHPDHLGTLRLRTNSAGAVQSRHDFYPFGGEHNATATDETHKFTDHERDSETGLDHTWFRKYASNLGRWTSPDPLGGTVINPQSLNRYGYVLNNPINFVDPFGLDHCVPSLRRRGEPDPCPHPPRACANGGLPEADCPFENGFLNPNGCYDVVLDGLDIGNTCDNYDFPGETGIDPDFDFFGRVQNKTEKAAFEACATKAQEKAVNQAFIILAASSTLDLGSLGCLATGPLAVECFLTLEFIALGTKAILVAPVAAGYFGGIAKCEQQRAH